MIRKSFRSLWGALVLFVFLIMLAAGILMFLISYVILTFKIIPIGHPNFAMVMFTIMLTSILLGTILTALSGKKILQPIRRINAAMRQVAKGNFDIELDEFSKISELDEVAHNFNIMVHELKGIETLRNDFVVNVSHEFKTPIASIEGYATLLQHTDLTEKERQEYAAMIIDSAQQISELSSNILKLSKLENQEIIVQKTWFDLDEQLRQAILMLEFTWSSKNLNLNIELDPVRYYGSEELLMQVWLNLLGNAMKFTGEDGNISIALTESANFVNVTIADSGIGMDKKVQKHIFEKFYQGDPSRAGEGNGLGLPLVKRIIGLSGGDIKVKSTPGEGSIFSVQLPKESQIS